MDPFWAVGADWGPESADRGLNQPIGVGGGLMVEKWVYVVVYWLGACLAVPITLFVVALVCEIVTRRRPPVDDGN